MPVLRVGLHVYSWMGLYSCFLQKILLEKLRVIHSELSQGRANRERALERKQRSVARLVTTQRGKVGNNAAWQGW